MTAYLQIKDVSVVFRFPESVADVLAAVATAIGKGAIVTANPGSEGVLINFRAVASADVDEQYDETQFTSKRVWRADLADFFGRQ